MAKFDDNQLTALALRNYAQTCEEIQRASRSHEPAISASWQERADRCRALAELFEKLAHITPALEPS